MARTKRGRERDKCDFRDEIYDEKTRVTHPKTEIASQATDGSHRFVENGMADEFRIVRVHDYLQTKKNNIFIVCLAFFLKHIYSSIILVYKK